MVGEHLAIQMNSSTENFTVMAQYMIMLVVVSFCIHRPVFSQSHDTNLEGLKKKLLYDTGAVYWELDEDKRSFIFTASDNCTLSIQLNKSKYKELVHNVTEAKLDEENIFHIRIMENTTFAEAYSIEGFAAINRAKKSHFKFLPFRLEDMTSIMRLTAPPVIREAAYYKTLDVYSPFPENCADLKKATSKNIQLAQLEDSTINIFITVLLLTITYNPYLDMPDVYEICSLNKQYKDIPFRVTTCCAVKEKLIFESYNRDQIIRCSGADRSREHLATFATVLGFFCFLFVPLLVKYLPATSEEWKKVKEKYLQKCISRKDGEHDEEDPEAGIKSEDANTETDKPSAKLLHNLLLKPPSLATHPKAEFELLKKKKTAVLVLSKDALLEMQENNDNGTNKTEEDTEDDDSDEEDDPEDERVYLDKDSEYYLSPAIIASYLLLFPSDSHIAAVLRRLLFLIFLWVVTGTLLFITYMYYDSVFDNCFLSPQKSLMQKVYRTVYAEEYQKFKENDPDNEYVSKVLHSMSFSGPITIACVNMILLYFVLVRPKNVCQTLSWYEDKKSLLKQEKGREVPPTKHLYYNMKYRLTRLASKKFWEIWWNRCICKCSPMYKFNTDHEDEEGPGNSSPNAVLQTLLVILRIPFAVIYLIFYTLPAFTFLRNIFSKPRQLLVCDPCQKRQNHFPFVIWLTFPMTLAGFALFYWMLFDLTLLLSHAGIFLSIDVLRNSETTLPIVVFIISVLLYIRQAFGDFEDGYRKMKGTVFEMSEAIAFEAESKGVKSVFAENSKTRLFRRGKGGQLSIPKAIFKTVCDKYRPYRNNLLKTVLKLLGSLMIIAFLFAITIEFQVFHEFSGVGETLLMVFTVSIPGLLGMFKSDDQKALSKAELHQKITATIRALVKEKAVHKRKSKILTKAEPESSFLGSNFDDIPETVI